MEVITLDNLKRASLLRLGKHQTTVGFDAQEGQTKRHQEDDSLQTSVYLELAFAGALEKKIAEKESLVQA